MKKFTFLIALSTCFVFATNARLEAQTDPGLLTTLKTNQFTNDLPVIKDLGLRVNLAKGKKGTQNIEVSMKQTYQDVLGLNIDTKVWGYKFPGLPTTYPGATIVANKNKPVKITWKNDLPPHFLPIDVSLHMAHPDFGGGLTPSEMIAATRAWYEAGNVPTVAHLHGGHTESASDGLPEAWFTQDFGETGQFFVKQQSSYSNDQEAATLWYHDHALGITRLNVYAGLAGFYLLRDDNEENLMENYIIPGDEYEIEIVIQDRMFDENGQLFWPAYPDEGPYNEFIYGEGAVLPDEDFPDGGPSALAEFFGDVILVNGKAWPKLDVEPRKYRFRLLNGSDSRFYILKLDNGAGFDNIMVIGTDDGLLEFPVAVTELAIAPGERYDVVVDFSGYVPSKNPLLMPKITLTNWGPDSPAAGWEVDPFDIADPATTGKIMQFQVTQPLSKTPDATVTFGTTLRSTIPPLTTNAPARQLVLFEGSDEYGRLQPMLGTLNAGSLTWSDAITETPALGAIEEWEVYNATMDAHPIHLHLVAFQILNRESFIGVLTPKDQPQHNGTIGTGSVLSNVSLGGDVTGPLPHELGWKDTFIVPPGMVGRVRAKFDLPGRYVWHCHILSHEDHEMMRPFYVGDPPAAAAGATKGAAVGDIQADKVDPAPYQGKEFSLYPNPASELITVDLMLEQGAEISISVYGFDGRVINSEKLGYLNDGLQSIAVPVDHLDNGMYILELKAGSKQFRESIIITK